MPDDDHIAEISIVDVKENVRKSRSTNIDESEPATFETAVTETKFGKLNFLLIAIALPTSLCAVFETTTMSYVFVAAQCDLKLSLNHKGLLNSITYAGMISSAMIWGFLFDVLGRKKLLTIGFLINGSLIVISAFAKSIVLLMVFKFLGGFIINGPSAAMSSYLSEFHCSKYRPMMQMVIGTVNATAAIILPSLAWLILPKSLNYSFFGGIIELHSWNFFILATSCPTLLSGLIFIFMPESPKYLMTCGENEKALKVFQWVYSINTGKSEDSFPIRQLVDETKQSKLTKHRSSLQALKEGFQQIRPLFHKPYLSKIILICLLAVCILLSHNSLRLWFPQIFQAVDDYANIHNGTTASLCVMVESAVPKNVTFENCVVNMDNTSVYITSITNGCVMVTGLIAVGSIIHFTGKKRLLVVGATLAGLCSFGLYFSYNAVTTTVLTSIFVTCGGVTTNIMAAVCVDLFPTTYRTLTVSMYYMAGRTGAMVGNLIFPFLLQSGCGPPFFLAGSMMLVAGVLCLLLPNTDNKSMQ